MPLLLKLYRETQVPLEVDGVNPDTIGSLSLEHIRATPIYHGNQSIPLGEFFEVTGDPNDHGIEFHGNLRGVHAIGAKMKSGTIDVFGDAGRHLGSEMSGGRIHVRGSVGDWAGAELTGGEIVVDGDAGDLVGAAYRGSPKGMTGGTIVVRGDVGNEIGGGIRRGLILIGGKAGDFIGVNMLAGTIVVGGNVGMRHGAGMRRGTLIFLGADVPEMLPTFSTAGRLRPAMFSLLSRELDRYNFGMSTELTGEFEQFHGDLLEGGRGEVFVRAGAIS